MKPEEDRGFEPPGQFRLLRWAAPDLHVSVTENLGLRGYGDLVRYVWAERRFDRKFDVRTEYLVPPAELGFGDSALQDGASRYRATPPYCVSMSLRRLRERLGGLGTHHLVDYGAGAGRVLILAGEAGIGRATGLELSPNLVAQCRDNLQRYGKAGLEVQEADATAYLPPASATIFYFFNPFSPEFFVKAMDGIRQSVQEHPRDIYVLLFQTFRYDAVLGLEFVGSVTGVQTYTNARDRDAFTAAFA